MSAVHDLTAIRARILERLDWLKPAVEALRPCPTILRELMNTKDVENAGRTFKEWQGQCDSWANIACLFNSAKTRVPLRVRRDVWAIPEVAALEWFEFRLAEPDHVWPLDQALREWVEAGGDPCAYRRITKGATPPAFSERLYYLPWLFQSLSYEPIWPDVDAAITKVGQYFTICEAEVEKRPDDFRLKPASNEVAIGAVLAILEERQTHSRLRVEARYPDDGLMRACALAAYDHISSERPSYGATCDDLRDELASRWPDITQEAVNTAILEAFRRGLIRANGGEKAHEQGFAADKSGEIVDPILLERWLKRPHGFRWPELVFHRVSLDSLHTAGGNGAATAELRATNGPKAASESAPNPLHDDEWAPAETIISLAYCASEGTLTKWAEKRPEIRRSANDEDRKRFNNPALRYVYNKRLCYERSEGRTGN